MKLVLIAMMFGGAVIGYAPAAAAQSQAELRSATPAVDLTALPALPKGKSTVVGGEIRTVDQVRDEVTLNVFGQRPMKILFDERTQIFRDGNKIRVRDLAPSDHASIQTTLDGTNVYALSIHLLSQSPEGEYEGRVLSYNVDSGELLLASAMLHNPIKLVVPVNTPVSRVGQSTFIQGHSESSDLVRGALISVGFQVDKQRRSVANRISVLATPGSDFAFVGNVSSLDMHSGMLTLVDPIDQQSYQIVFSSASLPVTRNLHTGDHIIVTAHFEGGRYMANAVTISN
jgi:hypothetical protein